MGFGFTVQGYLKAYEHRKVGCKDLGLGLWIYSSEGHDYTSRRRSRNLKVLTPHEPETLAGFRCRVALGAIFQAGPPTGSAEALLHKTLQHQSLQVRWPETPIPKPLPNII